MFVHTIWPRVSFTYATRSVAIEEDGTVTHGGTIIGRLVYVGDYHKPTPYTFDRENLGACTTERSAVATLVTYAARSGRI